MESSNTIMVKVITWNRFIQYMEIVLSIMVVMAMIVFALGSVETISNLNIAEPDSYFLLLRRILALAVGIELIRFFVTNHITVLIDILIFLLARQLLLIEMSEDYTHLLSISVAIALFISVRILVRRYDIY